MRDSAFNTLGNLVAYISKKLLKVSAILTLSEIGILLNFNLGGVMSRFL